MKTRSQHLRLAACICAQPRICGCGPPPAAARRCVAALASTDARRISL
jgi:hypothetical protein